MYTAQTVVQLNEVMNLSEEMHGHLMITVKNAYTDIVKAHPRMLYAQNSIHCIRLDWAASTGIHSDCVWCVCISNSNFMHALDLIGSA